MVAILVLLVLKIFSSFFWIKIGREGGKYENYKNDRSMY